MFDTGPIYGKDIAWDGYTVHDAACIMLRYFYTLPSSLISLAFSETLLSIYRDITAAFDTPDHSSDCGPVCEVIVSRFITLISDLEICNRWSILYLLDIFRIFEEHSIHNKLTMARLASVLHTCILREYDPDLGGKIARFLIIHWDILESRLLPGSVEAEDPYI